MLMVVEKYRKNNKKLELKTWKRDEFFSLELFIDISININSKVLKYFKSNLVKQILRD